MKQGIVVTGSEASGTKILAESIIKCMDVSGTIGGPVVPSDGPMLYRRSVPYGRPSIWPTPSQLANKLEAHGCDNITVVISTREWFSLVKSHQRQFTDLNESKTPSEILEKVRKCYKLIFDDISKNNMNFLISNYESLINDPENHLRNLASVLALPFVGMNVKITNQNKKYIGKDYQ